MRLLSILNNKIVRHTDKIFELCILPAFSIGYVRFVSLGQRLEIISELLFLKIEFGLPSILPKISEFKLDSR